MREAASTNHPLEWKRPLPSRERGFQRRCSHLESPQTIKITPTMMSNSGKIRRTFSLVCPLWCTPGSVIRTRKGRSPRSRTPALRYLEDRLSAKENKGRGGTLRNEPRPCVKLLSRVYE